MKINIPYKNTNQFSNLVIDYQKHDKSLKEFINYFPDIDNFQKQIHQKKKYPVNRDVLVDVLEKQNASIDLTNLSVKNLKSLRSENTFTITTGHQLCLFTGPLLLFYKIISSINLSEKLQSRYPNYKFVPVFWMATEDHDFEEINSINLFGEELVWSSKQRGSVGSMSLDGIEEVLIRMESILVNSNNAKKLMRLFRSAYMGHNNLADATRYLINELFGQYGLLIIDGNERVFKQNFLPQIKKDVYHKGFIDVIRLCSNKIGERYHVQAYARDINFFDLSNNNRVLIKKSDEFYNLSAEEFSPNVLLRTLYQESILPNIGIIGGPSEIAYWLQVFNAFKQEDIPYPIIVQRNCVLIMRQLQLKKIESLGLNVNDFFDDLDSIYKKYLLNKDASKISLNDERVLIRKIYSDILDKNNDKGLNDNINAELKRQLKVLDKIELRLVRSAKERESISIIQIKKIKNQLFPNNMLQERYNNFIPFYLEHGDNFIKILKNNLDPLDPNFVVLLD